MMLKVSLHISIIVSMTSMEELMDLMDIQILQFMLDNYETLMSCQQIIFINSSNF